MNIEHYTSKLGPLLKMQQLSIRGKIVANHYKIICKYGYALQSYDSIVAISMDGHIPVFGCNWDYSNTTIKHISAYFGGTPTEIRQGIKSNKFGYDKDIV